MVILRAAVTFRPARLLLLIAGFSASGRSRWARARGSTGCARPELAEWEIYRILLASLLATVSAIFVCGAVVAERIAATAHGRPPVRLGVTGMVREALHPANATRGWHGAPGRRVVIVWPGIVEFADHRRAVEMHWSRAMLASLLVVIAAMLA